MTLHIGPACLVDRFRGIAPRLSADFLAGIAALALLASCAGGPAKSTQGKAPGGGAGGEKVEAVQAAATMLEQGQADAAAAKLGEASAASPDDPELKLAQAAALVSAGKLPEGRKVVEDVLAANPTNVHALVLGAALARFADDQKARKAFLDRALAAAPADASVLSAWGEYYIDIENWSRAEASFRGSLAANAKNPDASLGLGRALYRQGKYAESEVQLTAAIEQEPDSPLAYSDRSRVRQKQGEYKEAASDLDTAIAKAPDASWLYLERGRYRLDSRDLAGAESDFDKAIALEPDYFLSYAYRGGIFEEAGKDEAALGDYRKVIQLYPDYWYAFESAGAAAFRLGLWDESAADFRRAYSASSSRYEYAIASALALWRSGKPKDASAYAKAVAATIDREKNGIYWNVLRLIQDQNDASSELEVQIQKESHLDLKCAIIFYLSEYWICRGKTELAAKYLDLAADMKREGTLEYRLIASERKRLAAVSNG